MLLKRFLVVAIALLCPALLFAQDSPTLALAPGVRSLASPEKTAIVETLERYFKGFDTMDPEAMSSVLHPEATVTGGVGQASVVISPYSETTEQIHLNG
jgi:hypothetical protein